MVAARTPTEAIERAFPIRVLRHRLREGRGGEGIERDLQMLEDVTVSLITERRVSQPWGLAGGEPGAAGENWLFPGGTWPEPSACRTSARSTSWPVTCFAC